MTPTTFWLIRHATVTPQALALLYGQMDVPICELRRAQDAPRYAALAQSLPRPAQWFVTPLSRTSLTAEAIMNAGYGPIAPRVEETLIEQDFGTWQGMRMDKFAERGARHPFWPVGGDEQPPDGESFAQLRQRVGAGLERLSTDHEGEHVVAVSHGGAIRAAVAHALDLTAHQALSLAVENLSVTRLERHDRAWRVVTVNEQISI
ncbi:MAG TPA: histidine phosphatase family protein [Acidiphilium sp.]|jgi:broad specificity phosphatase PhoE|uniref:histidine phosphatase family protein n=1 Tax=unclassified Acidiphilium TaxID=2617493 RepID=UPI000BDA0D79|nr:MULTISPECIES: histidine phosphatase family protein [unclassified Acidiphilium]OYV55512.1 MAG: histidine phosphatase family protein [Acidiphilium sp. 20-67-58]HQT61723.1 histidine phosphatase family protein [Acidiphilium sp.]HQU11149.1 histidine phosphatase family protein [Acidiphilium sp.]